MPRTPSIRHAITAATVTLGVMTSSRALSIPGTRHMGRGASRSTSASLSTAPNASASDAGHPAPTNASASVTSTLLPEVADRLLRTERVDPQPFPKLISAKNHDDKAHDCQRCHRVNGDAKLPKDHTESKDHAAWSLQSCDRCHLWENTRTPSKGVVSSVELAGNGYCVACHGNRTLKMDFPQGDRAVSMFVNRENYAHSVHGQLMLPCVGCHGAMTYPHDKVTVHSLREVARSIEKESCITCHKKQAEQFRQSVHGRALFEKSNLDVPGCTDCHGFHDADKTRTVHFRMGTVDTCAGCHANPKLAAKYKMSPDVTRNYLRDFHGTTIRLTRSQGPNISSYKPVCYDCHGVHDIQRTDDPRSTVMKEKLVLVCQKCHKGAGKNFSTAWMSHYEPSRKKWPVVYFVELAYKILIPLVMGQFGLYMLLDLMRWGLDRFRKGRRV